MSRNRLPTAGEAIRLPRPPAPPVAPGSFTLYPSTPLAGLNPQQQWLYQWAFAQAQEAARPSLPERDLAGVWN